MPLWNKKPARPVTDLPASDQVRLTGSPRAMWVDSLGRLATRSGQILLILLLASIAIYALLQIRIVAIPVFIALILSSALWPFVRWMRRRGVPRTLTTLGTMLGGLAVFGGFITLIVVGVRSEWEFLQEAVVEGIDTVQSFLQSNDLPIDAEQITEIRDAIGDFITSAQFGAGAIAGVSTAVELITGVVLTFVLLFFFLQDGPQIWEFLTRPLRPARRQRARRVGQKATEVLGGYATGTAIVASVDAIFIGLALWILGVPLALPLAIIVFITAFIPIVGATLAGVIAALVALVTNDLTTALIVTAVVIGVNQLEGNLLAPVVLGRSLRLHALVVLLALTVGTILGGIVGTFLSVPLAAVAWAVIKAWNTPDAARLEVEASARRRR